MNLQEISAPEALLTEDAKAALPYDFENFISVDGFFARRRARAKLKVLKTIHPAVMQALQPGERVYYVTSGQRVSAFEHFFIGWIAAHYNTAAFVFTPERILLIHLKSQKKRGAFISSISYADLRNVKTTGLGNFSLKFRNGKSVLFARMPRADRRYLRDFLTTVLDTNALKDRKASDIRHMCPQCFTETLGITRACSSCDLQFKSPARAALFSLIMPGLGDLYLGARFLGTCELLFMLYLWTSIIAGVNAAMSESGAWDPLVAALTMGFFFVLIHPIDALKSLYLARKGLLPLKPVRYAGE